MGKRGSGKSTLAKRVLSRFNRVMVFDPLQEYRDGEIITDIATLFSFARNPPEEFKIILRFQNVNQKLVMLQYEYAARVAFEMKNLLLVLEEAEIFINSGDESSYINYLISFGRHRGINLLAIGRRPREIPIKFRANFTTVISFRMTEPDDLQRLVAYGFDEAEILSLEQFEYATIGDAIL